MTAYIDSGLSDWLLSRVDVLKKQVYFNGWLKEPHSRWSKKTPKMNHPKQLKSNNL